MKLNTITEIKGAVDSGLTVYCGNGSYTVHKANGIYFIKCSINDYVIGLHGQAGTEYEHKLNGRDFYTIDMVASVDLDSRVDGLYREFIELNDLPFISADDLLCDDSINLDARQRLFLTGFIQISEAINS